MSTPNLRAVFVAAALVALSLATAPALGRVPVPLCDGPAEKALVVDGSGVLNAGHIHVNVTNWGLIGSHYGTTTTYSDAPSVQWPGGSGMEYVFGAGLWIGGRQNGNIGVTTGQPEPELLPGPEPQNVLYEARDGYQVRPRDLLEPTGVPADLPGGDDDHDGIADEDPLDGFDNDGDGRVDEDFAQYGSQMLTCLMRDDVPLARQMFPDHRPLGLEVRFSACAWSTTDAQDLIGLRWVIRNAGLHAIEDLYVGLLIDGDIGHHGDAAAGEDDLAGTFTGLVRRLEGGFADLAYAWMRDADAADAMPGWLGATLEGSGFGDRYAKRPDRFGINAIRILSAGFGVGYSALPVFDEERYGILERNVCDSDVPLARFGDYLVLLSVGPWTTLEPGEYVIVNGTLTVADGESALQAAMVANERTASGRWYNADGVGLSGRGGRETLICAEDLYTPWNSPLNPLYDHFHNFWNTTCRPRMFLDFRITPEDLFWDHDLRKHCWWASLDNCEECRRYYGVECTSETSLMAPCGSSAPAARLACTGTAGREANVPFASGELPPPVPELRVVPGDRAMDVYWDNRSERTPDLLTGLDDFESYRVWRADNWDRPPGSSERTGPDPIAWHLLAEFDRINFLVPREGQPPRAFGLNTGLADVAYRPVCLDDPEFAGLDAAMAAIVLADVNGRYTSRPPVRNQFGEPEPGLEALLPWETHPDVLDTFFAMTARSDSVGVPKVAVSYYRYHDELVHNGFLYFYAVTATDHIPHEDGAAVVGEGSGSLPTGSFVLAQPRFEAIEAGRHEELRPRPYVYPDPATRESLAEFQGLHATGDDPTGVRVSFVNLPRCRCTIQIFTLAGDLVQAIEHDGSGGDGQAYWNLVSRNGQEVASGIYLFAVTPHESGFEDQVGKFVVVR
ncbi:MAG TPA: hypothetical protein PLL30_14915 [Candidatus Krumholzibacteria bacterium]|nr:hypothetical protein [Candidatus Krumholzibacteria bacterium]HPD73060.1 hypothetical protein [Candidatus Krumholzibacteria bacterium]HRY41860.1 hypothetical protein [Candidatus Krumholzibacteria bacterium]